MGCISLCSWAACFPHPPLCYSSVSLFPSLRPYLPILSPGEAELQTPHKFSVYSPNSQHDCGIQQGNGGLTSETQAERCGYCWLSSGREMKGRQHKYPHIWVTVRVLAKGGTRMSSAGFQSVCLSCSLADGSVLRLLNLGAHQGWGS